MLSTDKSKKTELAATPAPMARKIKLPIYAMLYSSNTDEGFRCIPHVPHFAMNFVQPSNSSLIPITLTPVASHLSIHAHQAGGHSSRDAHPACCLVPGLPWDPPEQVEDRGFCSLAADSLFKWNFQ